MPVPNLPVTWFNDLPTLSKSERSTLVVLHQNADSRLEKYRLANYLMTDLEIGLQRYYKQDVKLAEYAAKIIVLQEKCLSGIKLVQEDWSPLFSGCQIEGRLSIAELSRHPTRGKNKPSQEVLAKIERRICVADALENAAYHSYAQQNPAGIKAMVDAMVEIQVIEAACTRKSDKKDVKDRTEALITRKIFELLSTNISVKQVKEVKEVKLEEAA